MSTITVNKENFETQVLKSEKPVLLDFWAGWCGPCRMLSPIVEELSNEQPGTVFGKVNIDEQRELADKFSVTSIPTLVLIKNGKPVSVSVGVRPKAQIEAMLK